VAKSIVEQLEPIFNPHSVAIVGASNVPFKWGAQTIQRLLQSGYSGAIYPINPREDVIQNLPAYHSVLDIPEAVDLAIITVRADQVPQALLECVEKGIKGAIIISADFAETGSYGQELQEEITRIAKQSGLRVVGPNCMGLSNATANINTFPGVSIKGSVGFISQSGSLSHMLARIAGTRGFGMSKIISVGNQADLGVADYLKYLVEDPDTEVIAIYLEGLKDGRKLFQVAHETAGLKPVVVYKTGTHPGSARVAMSHTAAIIGEDRIFDAMCQQVGFIRSPDLYSLLDMAGVLTRQPLPVGNRVGIQGTGGLCMVTADACLTMGMQIPEIRDEDIASVISGIDFPPHAPPPRNPIDFAGSHTALMDATALNNLARLDYIDGVISNRPVTFNLSAESDEQQKLDAKVGELLAAIPRDYRKPAILIGPAAGRDMEMFGMSNTINKTLDNVGIPCLSSPEEAVRAMYALMKYAEIKERFARG
jgi:acyl-CoA synthetase (NDP forming)